MLSLVYGSVCLSAVRFNASHKSKPKNTIMSAFTQHIIQQNSKQLSPDSSCNVVLVIREKSETNTMTALCSRLRLSSTDPCPAMPRVTWLTTVSSSLAPVSDNCILPTLKHSLSVGRAAILETGPLPPQNHKSEAVCHPISDNVGCHMASSGSY